MKHDIVVIGASSGGFDALRTIISQLPRDFPASVFITLHTAPTGTGYLAELLAAVSPIPVISPKSTEEIRTGFIYVAPPNRHLIIKRGFVAIRFLPKENGTRPAIDPMFRTAAHSYARRVIGVLLTGNLDDGTAGLGVIKDEGGLTIVQDPKDAMYPDMPLAAIKTVSQDYVVPLSEIPPLIVDLVNTEIKGEAPAEVPEIKRVAPALTCPGCGGVLTHYRADKVGWYQCVVGHRFTTETMVLEQNTMMEEIFWRILSLLKEKEEVARTMACDARAAINPPVEPEYFDQQVKVAKEAQEELSKMLDRLGPLLFPSVPQKERASADN